MNYLKYIFSLLFMTLTFAFTQAQEFHTSNTKIDYEVESGTLNMTTRFFTSHLEKAVGEKTSNKAAFEGKLKGYLNNKLSVKVNGKPITLAYFGFQTNDKSTRIYLKVEKVSDISSLEMKLDFLTEVFDDQQNMVNVEIKNNRKTYSLRKDNDQIKMTF